MRTLRPLLIAILLMAILCGCTTPSEQEFTCRGLSITLGPEYRDCSREPAGKNLDFLYVSDQIGFTGVCDSKTQFEELYPGLQLSAYAELTAKNSGIASPVQIYRGIPYYIYTSNPDGTEYTYLAAAFEGPVTFWLLQCYCKSSEFSALEQQIWDALETVRFT